MKFTGEIFTSLCLMLAVTMVALAGYEIVEMFKAILELGD